MVILANPRHAVLAVARAGALALAGCGGTPPPSAPPQVSTDQGVAGALPFYESAEEMLAKATTVIVGRVLHWDSQMIDISGTPVSDDADHNAPPEALGGEPASSEFVHTVYAIAVEDALKGAPAGDVMVKIPGGELAGVTQGAAGAPDLATSADDLIVLFFEDHGGGIPSSPLNFDQAILAVARVAQRVGPLDEVSLGEEFLDGVGALVFTH